jgi:hypothetical protein
VLGQRSKKYLTAEFKEKISNQVKERWRNGLYDHILKSKYFSSKNERQIVSYFKTTYLNDEWKSGGQLALNQEISLARDMWSDKLKICFEYDGIWHFKDIKNQLHQKQYKDSLLEKWCIDNDYRLIRIDEEMFESIHQIERLIYNNTQQIIKIGNRYPSAPPICWACIGAVFETVCA